MHDMRKMRGGMPGARDREEGRADGVRPLRRVHKLLALRRGLPGGRCDLRRISARGVRKDTEDEDAGLRGGARAADAAAERAGVQGQGSAARDARGACARRGAVAHRPQRAAGATGRRNRPRSDKQARHADIENVQPHGRPAREPGGERPDPRVRGQGHGG